MKRYTPLKSIRKYCYWCMLGSAPEIKLCSNTKCPFHKVRMGKKEKGVSTLKQIRKRCLECQEGMAKVKNCEHTDCPLHSYRLGHNPARKGIGGNIAERLRKRT